MRQNAPPAVIPAQAGIHFAFRPASKIKMDYTPLLRRALRTIRYANVRFGILLPRSRGNDVLRKRWPFAVEWRA